MIGSTWLTKFSLVLILCGVILGCSTNKVTTTERSAVEMALLSASADQSLNNLKGPTPYYSRFYIDEKNFEAADEEYILRSMRLYLLKKGMHSVDNPKEADVIVYPRAAVSAIDDSNFLLGIPTLPFALPGIGNATLPEIALFAKRKQLGRNRLGMYAVNVSDNRLAFDLGMASGEKFYTRYVVLFFFGFAHTNINNHQKDSKD